MTVTAAFGGTRWSKRMENPREDMPKWWGDWEGAPEPVTLNAVLPQRLGPQREDVEEFDAMQMGNDLLPNVACANRETIA